MNRSGIRSSEKGFSLLETALSSVLITVASLALVHSLALSFQVLQRSRTLRMESLWQWNQVQLWRAEIDAAAGTGQEAPTTLHHSSWDPSDGGVEQLEAWHGRR